MHRRRNSDIVRLGGHDARGDVASQVEHPMRALIERQLYHPTFVLPMIALMQLMVALNFNPTQVILIVVTKGVQSGWHVLHHAAVHPYWAARSIHSAIATASVVAIERNPLRTQPRVRACPILRAAMLANRPLTEQTGNR
ncbi:MULTISPECIES: hypothetical protein [Mycetohabitans]|uniref:hypothetical protein n=2 Tax=Burkholderiaceae TaxID=119060 RepID=UPI0011157B56|nr:MULTISPECIES: hypothetical protein [unclassified Mycetohabitans]MCF2134224.1 hypothetical protein [Mycetohabitans sp. B3]MCG1039470.1 hypothetical protein [Mycetohabitans sp. B7]